MVCDILEEDVCSEIKQGCIDRQISEKDLDTLFRYFGWRL